MKRAYVSCCVVVAMLGAAALLMALIPRGWLLVGLLGLVPALVAGGTPLGRS